MCYNSKKSNELTELMFSMTDHVTNVSRANRTGYNRVMYGLYRLHCDLYEGQPICDKRYAQITVNAYQLIDEARNAVT